MPEDLEYAPDCENVEDAKLKLPTKVIDKVEAKSGEEDEDVIYHEYNSNGEVVMYVDVLDCSFSLLRINMVMKFVRIFGKREELERFVF